ncbi:MAG: DUF2148 domain-containing protein [Dehalococcoidales bacterium]
MSIDSNEAEKDGILTAAKLMAVSARTAPKGRGLDSIKTLILNKREELEKLATAMEAAFREDPKRLDFFQRNANDVRKSTAVLLIGVTGEPKSIESPLNCGACGIDCPGMAKAKKKDQGMMRGPMCHMQSIDLGIALGSAVKTASELNIDNRMMFSIGAASRRVKLMDADFVVGIPLATMGKNPYFPIR